MTGFVYIWFDRKHKRFYIGSHWGSENDSYICSSSWMKRAYKKRPHDFKRRIISRNIKSKVELLNEEQRWFNFIKPEEIGKKYYNLNTNAHKLWHSENNEYSKSIGQKISAAKKGIPTGPRDPLIGEKISKVKKQNFEKKLQETGSKFSAEHRKKISEAKFGVKSPKKGIPITEEQKKKISAKLSGTKLPDSTKKKISESLKGRNVSEDTRSKLSQSNKKKYEVKYFNSEPFVIIGLEDFCNQTSIPMVTASVASRKQSPIKKYSIEYIKRIDL